MLQCTDPKRHQISRGTRRFWIASSVPCMCIYNTLSFAKALPLLVKKNDPYREDISCTTQASLCKAKLLTVRKNTDTVCLTSKIKSTRIPTQFASGMSIDPLLASDHSFILDHNDTRFGIHQSGKLFPEKIVPKFIVKLNQMANQLRPRSPRTDNFSLLQIKIM